MIKEELRKEWSDRVLQFKASGQAQSAWCREQDINIRKFNYWYIKSKKPVSQTSNPSKWVSLKVAEQKAKPQDSVLVIKIGQAALEVKPEFDQKFLVEVLKTLSLLC